MSRYRRVRIEGGWFFFTLTLADRSTDLLVRHIERLRAAYAGAVRRDPFETIAICVLPDHLHAIWALPPDDADFSRRWSLIKHDFSCGLPGNPSAPNAKREYGSAAIGSTRSAMTPISRATSTTFTTIRSNTAWCRAPAIGHIVHFTVTSRGNFCRRIGLAMRNNRRLALSANKITRP
jgi:REP element-mobilizing transposase RayT